VIGCERRSDPGERRDAATLVDLGLTIALTAAIVISIRDAEPEPDTATLDPGTSRMRFQMEGSRSARIVSA
jgi:hypothetical protein